MTGAGYTNPVVERLSTRRLSVGTATIGGMADTVPEPQAQAMLERALELGIDYLDTAPFYGLGRSEHAVGRAMRGAHSRPPVLSTKVGRLLKPYYGPNGPREGWADPMPFEPIYDYSYKGVMRSFSDSQQRLGVAYVDVVYVHDIGTMVHEAEAAAKYWKQLAGGGFRALQELKDSGRVGAIGLGVNEWQVLVDAMEIGPWDVFLLAGRYTLLEQTSLEPCLSSCLERGVAVVCGGPFNGGALVGSGTWNYEAAPKGVVERVQAIEEICRLYDVPIGAAALQFPLAHPAIVTVLAGPKSASELDGLVQWMDYEIPPDLWASLRHAGLIDEAAPIPR